MEHFVLPVEILDPHARPMPGCAGADSVPFQGDATAHPVRWRNAGDVPVGQPVRLRLRAQNAEVYAIFSPAPGETPAYCRFSAASP